MLSRNSFKSPPRAPIPARRDAAASCARAAAMPETPLANAKAWAELLQQFALELALAKPGADDGLLPLNCFVMQLEETASAAPASFAGAIAAARARLDFVFESTGHFRAEDLAWLQEWLAWMQCAVGCWQHLLDLPAMPEDWSQPNPTRVPAPAPAPSAPEPLAPPLDGELLREFVTEALEGLDRVEKAALTLEQKDHDAESLNTIFRAFHTLKGNAGFLKLTAIQDFAHTIESVLDAARRDELPVTRKVIDLMLDARDALIRIIASEEIGRNDPHVFEPLAARAHALLQGRDAHRAAPAPAREIPAVPMPAKPDSAGASVRVDTRKLDSLVDAIGELMVVQSIITQSLSVSVLEDEALSRSLDRLRRITRDLQRDALALRLVPVGPIFDKMGRVVRDISAAHHKPVRLDIQGADTELDRTMVELLADPLLHMIRNAIDHGIESAAQRAEHGKPTEGAIQLRAFHRGGDVVVQVEDDGGGLDRERIRQKAIERGVISPDDPLSDPDLVRVIFQPGFSTAKNVTELSGRGVGLDVVERNIQKLRGRVEVTSTPGRGTCFTIVLPLTLAIIDGLVLGAGSQRYVVPALSVRHSFRPTREMLSTLRERGEIVNVRGRLTPLLRLYEHLQVAPRTTDPTEAVLVMVESGAHARCLMVDELVGKQEVVIKSVGAAAGQCPAVSGAAILSDGNVGLILDVAFLVNTHGPRAFAA